MYSVLRSIHTRIYIFYEYIWICEHQLVLVTSQQTPSDREYWRLFSLRKHHICVSTTKQLFHRVHHLGFLHLYCPLSQRFSKQFNPLYTPLKHFQDTQLVSVSVNRSIERSSCPFRDPRKTQKISVICPLTCRLADDASIHTYTSDFLYSVLVLRSLLLTFSYSLVSWKFNVISTQDSSIQLPDERDNRFFSFCGHTFPNSCNGTHQNDLKTQRDLL
jgi:hypothetical protein